MLTKEECEKALDSIYKVADKLVLNHNIFIGSYDILKKLIHEHFDNPPLKFEELKEGMFVWDKKQNTWIEISEISEYQSIKFYMIGWECKETILYEPNRFYRKEVHK